jgi:hypothetical protein
VLCSNTQRCLLNKFARVNDSLTHS